MKWVGFSRIWGNEEAAEREEVKGIEERERKVIMFRGLLILVEKWFGGFECVLLDYGNKIWVTAEHKHTERARRTRKQRQLATILRVGLSICFFYKIPADGFEIL